MDKKLALSILLFLFRLGFSPSFFTHPFLCSVVGRRESPNTLFSYLISVSKHGRISLLSLLGTLKSGFPGIISICIFFLFSLLRRPSWACASVTVHERRPNPRYGKPQEYTHAPYIIKNRHNQSLGYCSLTMDPKPNRPKIGLGN